MTEEEKEILNEFIEESRDKLDTIEGDFLEIENADESAVQEIINNIFREIHSIKGVAGFLNLNKIQELAHSMENVLNKIRENELKAETDNVNILLRSLDVLVSLFHKSEDDSSIDITVSLAELKVLLNSIAKVPAPEPEPEPTIETEKEITEPQASQKEVVAEVPSQVEPPVKPEPALTVEEVTESQEKGSDFKDHQASTVRVSIKALDKLMNLAGELVLTRNQLNQSVTSRDMQTIENGAQKLDLVTSSLQEIIMTTRMQPVGNVFNKFIRVVRDLSQHLSKKINLEIQGKDVELDKSILENISDPLTHLVRNALDHGLEITEERIKAGKPETGNIKLAALHESGQVTILIQDDGKGIDANKIADSVIKKSLMDRTTLDGMTEKEIIRLIFLPGFSTAQQVSDISGRGVGMDVVQTNLAKLGGTIDIDTKIGQGTTFKIKLPLTLAIIPSLLVEVEKVSYAISQINLVELVRVPLNVEESPIEKIDNSNLFRLRGKLIPLLYFRDFIENKEEHTDIASLKGTIDALNIVIVKAGNYEYGMAVDAFKDSEEIVVKPLGAHLKDCQGYAGATILGNGKTALILDIIGIAECMDIQSSSEKTMTQSEQMEKKHIDQNSVELIVTEHAHGELFAFKLEEIDRITNIKKEEIHLVNGKPVINYQGKALPIIYFDQLLDYSPLPEDKEVLELFHFKHNGSSFGIVTQKVIDIIRHDGSFDQQTFSQKGLRGSFNLRENIVLYLNPFDLIDMSHSVNQVH